MKALSIIQPWASLIVLGCKHVETRPWATAHRGLIAIHASKNVTAAARALCRTEPVRGLLEAAGCLHWRELPAGKIIGLARVTDCIRVEELLGIPELERQLGDFGPGRWAWLLAGAAPLPEPVPYRGRLGLYEVPDELLAHGKVAS